MHLVLKWQCYKLENCILEIHGILNMPQVLNIQSFWMDQEFKFPIVSQGLLTGFLICLGFCKMREFWIIPQCWICQGQAGFIICLYKSLNKYRVLTKFSKKCYLICAWQGSEYFSLSEYVRDVNMSWLHQVLKKMLHHRCLTGFWTFLFDMFLNMSQVLKWQG